MQQRKIYKTLRVRYNDELKLFPSWKIESVHDLKDKVIARFDLSMRKEQFQVEYWDEDRQEMVVLEDLDEGKVLDGLVEKLIARKAQLQVRKRQSSYKKLQKSERLILQINHKELQKQLQQQQPIISQHTQHLTQKHCAQCDDCLQFPITGIRYKCIICEDYDLCQQCYLKLQSQTAKQCHPFIKIRHPIEKIDSISVTFDENQLIKMNQICQREKEQKNVQEKKNIVEIEQSKLPQKDLVGRNFVECLFDQDCVKRQFESPQTMYRKTVPILDFCS